MDHFGFKIKIFQVRKEGIQYLNEDFSYPRIHFVDAVLQPPGCVSDKVEKKREDGTQDGSGEAGKKEGHGCNQADLDKDIDDGYQQLPFNREGVKKDQGKKYETHQEKHDEKSQNKAQIFSEQELIAMDGLGEDGVNSLLVNLFVNKACAHQDGHQCPEKGKRTQADILDYFDSVAHGEESQKAGESNTDSSEKKKQIQDSVSYRFLECV